MCIYIHIYNNFIERHNLVWEKESINVRNTALKTNCMVQFQPPLREKLFVSCALMFSPITGRK